MPDSTYEMVLMLDPESGDDRRTEIAAEVKSKLTAGGEIAHEADWGLRRMAYEIEKRESADYRFFKFSGGKELLDELDHSLKITDGVLRFRIFRAEPDSPVMEPPDTEQVMRRDEDDRERGGRGRGPRRRYEDDAGGDRDSSGPSPAGARSE